MMDPRPFVMLAFVLCIAAALLAAVFTGLILRPVL